MWQYDKEQVSVLGNRQTKLNAHFLHYLHDKIQKTTLFNDISTMCLVNFKFFTFCLNVKPKL